MDDTVGQWSIEKLALLKRYLGAYVNILRKASWCSGYEYIDGFAGTGRPLSRDEHDYVSGSPRVALELDYPFTEYHFIELTEWRMHELQKLRREFTDRRITIYQDDCNKTLQQYIIPRLPYQSRKRAIAFLDPFGMQLRWQTLKMAAETRTIEVFLNLPVMAINRNVRRKHPEMISPSAKAAMDELWGADWMAEIYETVPNLFGEEEETRIKQSGKDLGRRFRDRLRQIFTYCADPLVMKNSRGAPLYCLIFAGNNETGAKIAGEIFSKYERMA